jgi:hypothetical protein
VTEICPTCRQVIKERKPLGRARSPLRLAIVAAALETIPAGGMSTRELSLWLGRRNIPVPGKHRINSLSAILSDSGRFWFDARAGAWRIKVGTDATAAE